MESASLSIEPNTEPSREVIPERPPIVDCTMVLRDATSGLWLSFQHPELVVVAHDVSQVAACMQSVEERVERDGLFAAGFVSYEAAPAFDLALSTRSDCSIPLLLFGLFRRPTETREYPLLQSSELGPELGPDHCADHCADHSEPGAAAWCKRESDAEYGSAFNRIKCEISAGNLYQINHTVRLQSSDWNEVQMVSRAPYGAHIETDEWLIASASPELFFRLDGREIVSQPMKGTAGRGLDSASDLRARAWLGDSLKNRAENLMITDMVRNDIGRIAEAGSVAVDGLFAVEQFPTVWQMTSTVSAKTTAGVTDIFRALFPAASITGAPKRASMDLISQLEPKPREIYTGAIGYLAPGRKCQFSVAIRTVLYDKRAQQATYGVGGAIVWDSVEAEELREIGLKSQVLQTSGARLVGALLETMRWEPGLGVFLKDLHFGRLLASARYFAVPLERAALEEAVECVVASLGSSVQRIRLVVACDGSIDVQAEPFVLQSNQPQRVALAATVVDRRDVRFYHKSTVRSFYDRASDSVGADAEALLCNSEGEITESVIANVVYRLNGQLYTPPVACGLLAGTLRKQLLLDGVVHERILRRDELAMVEQLYLVNALRGWREAQWVPNPND